MKSKEQYIVEYESILKQTQEEQRKLNNLNIQKRQLQDSGNKVDQILSLDQQISALTTRLLELNGQTSTQKNELSGLTGNDNNLKQTISNLERQHNSTKETTSNYDKAFTDIMVILNGFSAKEGLNLNQTAVLIKILSPEELLHTDVLKKACEMNHREEFDKAIDKITNLNFKDSEGKTILMYAIINGFYYGVDKLLQASADVNIVDNKGSNALLYCAQNPHIKYIKLIADKTTDVEHKDSTGNNALHYLVSNSRVVLSDELMSELKDLDTGHYGGGTLVINCNFTLTSMLGVRADGYTVQQAKVLRIIKYLTEIPTTQKPIDINSQNTQGQTAFFIACDQSLLYLAQELLRQYSGTIDFNIKDINANTYLHYAARLPDATDIVESMLNKVDINTKNTGGGTAILQASMRNSVKTLELLAQKNGDLNILDIEGRHSWHYASQYGAIDAMKFLKSKIPSIIDLRTSNASSATSLHTVSEVGNLAIAKWLVEQQADINAKTGNHGLTPFFIACMKKNTPMAEFFFNHTRFSNVIVDKSGFGTLHWGLELRNIAILQRILDEGVDIDLRDNEGKTALFWSVHYNWLEETKFLLDHSASANISNIYSAYPLHTASSLGFIDIVKLLANRADLNVRTTDEHKFTALYLASQDGKLPIVKILADKGADLNIVRASNGMPPLHVAMQHKHAEVIKELLTRGAEVNIVDASGWIALHWAASLGDVSIASSILGKNTNINARNNGGGTPLYIGVYNNNKPMTELLIHNNADINIADNAGTYPWHLAAFQGYLELLKVLKPKVLDIDCKTNNIDKYTALWYASQEGKLETVKWLIDNHADVNVARESDGCTALQASICKKSFPVIEELVERGCEVNKGDAKHYTPLYYAVELQELKTIKFLIEHGANVTLAGDSGDQPIHMASKLCNLLIIKILIELGANVDVANNSGNTPMHQVLLESNSSKSNDEKLNAVKYLLAKSAKTDIKNSKEETAIDLAKNYFQEAMPYLEHPENLPPLSELEASILGLDNDFMV